MAGKPKLHYSNGRGRMESIRWLLATAGVEFEEQFIEKKEDLEKLRNDGYLLFQQVPMVEIDGMKMVQTRAIGSYIAAKYNLYGKDLKERAWLVFMPWVTNADLDIYTVDKMNPALDEAAGKTLVNLVLKHRSHRADASTPDPKWSKMSTLTLLCIL
uniref:glutathione transferase n=1 Tax=Strigops habroptila TaxID=2489341 RepID=A0A672VG37_STRHB